MAGLAHPLLVVQIFWGRRDIMCTLLHMAPTLLLMALPFLLMVHLLLRNHLQLMAVLALDLGRPTSEQRRPICPLAIVFLLAMVCRIMHTNLTWVVSHILEPTRNLEPTNL